VLHALAEVGANRSGEANGWKRHWRNPGPWKRAPAQPHASGSNLRLSYTIEHKSLPGKMKVFLVECLESAVRWRSGHGIILTLSRPFRLGLRSLKRENRHHKKTRVPAAAVLDA